MEPDAITYSLIQADAFSIANLLYGIILVALLIISALVSSSEVAYFSLTPGQVENLKENHKLVYSLHQKPERLLATILISNNFVNVGIVIISSYLVDAVFNFSHYPVLGFIIQVIVVTFIILLFGEITPKLYANRAKERVAIFMAPVLNTLNYVFRPISSLLIRSTSIISKRMEKKNSISIDQLSKALELTNDAEINEEKDILEGIVRFSNIRAIDIIQPRINIIAVDIDDDFEHVKNMVIEHSYSRMPVYNGNLDNIVGILYIKDLLPYLKEDKQFAWQKLTRKVFFVPETKRINDLLEEFQSKKVHMAVVVDEYGGSMGIVTMEDVLEEIIGDINDETDEQEDKFTKLDDHTYIFEGYTLLNDFEKILDLEDDCFSKIEGEADTLAGLILEIKGEMPRKNEVVTFKNHKFTILDVNNRRIKKIKYEMTPLNDENPQEEYEEE